MTAVANTMEMTLLVSDVSGQKQRKIARPPLDGSIAELIQGLLPQMRLPEADVNGRPLVYQARLEREGRHLHGSEVIGEAVQPDDRSGRQVCIDLKKGASTLNA